MPLGSGIPNLENIQKILDKLKQGARLAKQFGPASTASVSIANAAQLIGEEASAGGFQISTEIEFGFGLGADAFDIIGFDLGVSLGAGSLSGEISGGLGESRSLVEFRVNSNGVQVLGGNVINSYRFSLGELAVSSLGKIRGGDKLAKLVKVGTKAIPVELIVKFSTRTNGEIAISYELTFGADAFVASANIGPVWAIKQTGRPVELLVDDPDDGLIAKAKRFVLDSDGAGFAYRSRGSNPFSGLEDRVSLRTGAFSNPNSAEWNEAFADIAGKLKSYRGADREVYLALLLYQKAGLSGAYTFKGDFPAAFTAGLGGTPSRYNPERGLGNSIVIESYLENGVTKYRTVHIIDAYERNATLIGAFNNGDTRRTFYHSVLTVDGLVDRTSTGRPKTDIITAWLSDNFAVPRSYAILGGLSANMIEGDSTDYDNDGERITGLASRNYDVWAANSARDGDSYWVRLPKPTGGYRVVHYSKASEYVGQIITETIKIAPTATTEPAAESAPEQLEEIIVTAKRRTGKSKKPLPEIDDIKIKKSGIELEISKKTASAAQGAFIDGDLLKQKVSGTGLPVENIVINPPSVITPNLTLTPDAPAGATGISVQVTPSNGASRTTVSEEFDASGNRLSLQTVTQDVDPEALKIFRYNSNGDPIDKNGKVLPYIREEGKLGLTYKRKYDFTNAEVAATRDPEFKSVVSYTSGPKKGTTTIRSSESPLGIEFDRAGAILGSLLGKSLAGDDQIKRVVFSAFFKTVGQTLGDLLDASFDGQEHTPVSGVLKSFGSNLLRNLGLRAAGAVSSYLVKELVGELGIDGFAGEVVNTAASEALRSAITNVMGLADNAIGANVVNAIGSLIGAKLASQVVTFKSVGGQIGSVIGTTLGPVIASALLGGPLTFLGVVVFSFLGTILGGVLGSVFGGTPRSGADVQWQESIGRFEVANGYSKLGGSKEVARSLAGNVASTLNTILDAADGKLDNPSLVTTGNYGMRSTDIVYRPTSTRDKSAITYRLGSKSKDAMGKMVGYGVYEAVTDADFKIVGGDTYIKRAIYNTFELERPDRYNFDINSLIGNIIVAQKYESLLQNYSIVSALVSAEPDSQFAIETLLAFAQAKDLGLTNRHRSDWFGGFTYLLESQKQSAANVDFGLHFDLYSVKFSRVITIGDLYIEDQIDVSGQTDVELTELGDTIDLRGETIYDQRGYYIDGILNDDIAVNVEDFVSQTDASIIFAASALRASAIVTGLADSTASEQAEKFLGQLSNGTGVSVVGGSAEATIVDGTAALPTLLVGRSYALESDGHATFRLSLSKAAGAAVSVDLATAAANATAGTDYGAGVEVSADGLTGWTAATSATFAAGQTQLFARVAVLADNGVGADLKPTNVEGNERFTLTATVTAGAASIANVADATTGVVAVSGTGTIVDASVGTTPLAWIDNVIADEASGSAIFSIARSKAGTAASLNFSTADTKKLVIDVAATVDAGGGDDVVYASNLGDNIFGGEGNDTLYGGRLDDWLLGGDGNDVLNAGSDGAGTLGGDGNYLNGGAGDDLLIGREGSDWLEGGDGTDTLEGGDGGDILAGGGGAGDVLRGGRGDDQYIFRVGDADDLVRDESGLSVQQVVGQAFQGQSAATVNARVAQALTGDLFELGSGLNNWAGGGVQVSAQGVAAGGEDALVFGAGIGLEDIKISKSTDGKDLIIELWPDQVFAGDRMTLQDWFTSFNKVEILRFADGNEVRIADFDTFILGSDGTDTIIGTAGNDFVHAGAGNDIVYLLSGNDFGNGGLGDDTVSGDSGNDIVLGSDGNDTLTGGYGQDSVSGGRGNDVLTGDDGNDIVAGGAGDDEVIGGAGDDIFKFQRGDGRDTFIDALSNEWEVVWVSGAGFSAGYTLNADGTISHNTAGIIFNGTAWNSRIRYDMEQGKLWRHAPASATVIVADSGEDMIEFGLGIDINDIQFGSGNGGKDLIIGIESAGGGAGAFASLGDQITLKEWGTAGNAAARGSIEKLVFFNTGAVNVNAMNLAGGNDGNDSVTGNATAENWLTGGAGDDTLTGGGVNDILNGNSGQDRLVGGVGSDVLLGGAHNDVLIGGAGGTRDGNASAGDILIGGDGLDTASYETATVGVTASLSGMTANAGDAAGDIFEGVENLRGSDVIGTGSAIVDILDGDEFENELTGGKGNDELRGAAGDDIYVFGRDDGNDVIIDQLVGAETVIVAQDGQNPSGPALVANLQPPYASSVQLVDRAGAIYQFEHIVTNSETGEVIYRKEFAGTVGAGAGSLGYYDFGYEGGLASPSTLDADGWVVNEDSSTRFTVTGSKVHFVSSYAGAGSDTILFEDYTGNAGVTGDATIALSDLSISFTGNDLVITVNNSGGSVTLKNFKTASGFNAAQAIEALQFSDGSSVNLAGLVFNPATGALLAASTDTTTTPVNDFIVTNATTAATGNYGNDTMLGGAAINNLQGGEGDDWLVGGMGADTLAGGVGNDTVSYAGSDGTAGVNVNLSITTAQTTVTGSESTGDLISGVENAVGSQYNDTLTGSGDHNILRGLRGNDIISGGTGTGNLKGLGNDVLIGDDGNDTLTGGVHEDNLDGGTGNDILEGGGDRDVLAGGDGDDILRGDTTTTSVTAESATDEVGGNLLVNESFEAAIDGSVTAVWTSSSTRPVQTLTTGITGFVGAKAVHLDDSTGNIMVTQEIKNLSAGESLSLQFLLAGKVAGASSAVEVLWNNEVIGTYNNPTTTLTNQTINIATAKVMEGTNTLSFRGIGAVDGSGGAIDNVRLTRVSGGADQLIGGAGRDRLLGGGGNDVLLGGDGDDSGTNISAGAIAQAFAPGLFGGAGNDILDGGTGNDTLDGGTGKDSYVFYAGSGNDSVTIGGGQDDLVHKDINSNQLWLRQVGSDLEITAIGLGSTVLVKNWFTSAFNEPNKARRIVAADKTLARSDVQALVTAMNAVSATVPAAWPTTPTQTFSDVLATAWQDNASYVDRAVITGTANTDTGTTALASDPVLIGAARYEALAGNDTINATRLNTDGTEQVLDDILVGGAGTDTMIGGAGDDSFLFDTDVAFDTIHGGQGGGDTAGTLGSNDTLLATINNARINITAMSGIEAISAGVYSGVQIYAASGTTLNLSNVTLTGIAQINGAAGNETISGSVGNDVIFGMAGNDTLSGGDGNDTIRGGLGTNILDGGAGIDTLDLSDLGTAITVTLNAVGSASFSTGSNSTLSSNTISNFENLFGGTAADIITGSTADNRLEGRAGNDNILGGDGNDLLIGGVGADILKGGAGNDTASYETQAAVSTTTSVVDTVTINGIVANLATMSSTNGTTSPTPKGLQGDAANDWFYQIENLRGSNFSDALTGDANANILTGLAGNDVLDGGGGSDTVVYSGKFADYLVTFGATTVIQDLNTADGLNEGTDRLKNAETLQFADITLNLGVASNSAPIIGASPINDQSWQDGVNSTFTVPAGAFYDIDLTDGLTYSITLEDGSALPGWINYSPGSNNFSGTASLAMADTVLRIKVTATEVAPNGQTGATSEARYFNLAITDAAAAPVNATTGVALAGSDRRDDMRGSTGNDIFMGSLRADRIDGQSSTPPGGDMVDYSASDAAVTVDLVAGTGSGGHAEGDTLIAIEEIKGSGFDDNITGTAGGDKLWGGNGADTVNGGGGDDLIDGQAGSDTLLGGAGNDTIYARALADGRLEDGADGGTGADWLRLDDSIYGANIDLTAASGNPVSIEHVNGSAFDDTITGNEYANILSGGQGNDILRGGYGADTLHGDLGNDVVEGGEGGDSVYGDDGDDRLVGGAGADALYGGAGNDTIDYRTSGGGVTINLATSSGNGGDATGDVFAIGTIENVDGSEFADSLTGNSDANILKGFGGNDIFAGGQGNDVFDGGAGDDKIVYTGNRVGYSVDFAAKTITDVNLADGNDGVDSFASIESIQFADQTLNVSNAPPVVAGGLSNQSRIDNAAFTYVIPTTAFDDPDGSQGDAYKGLSFTAGLAGGGALPSWLVFDALNKRFTYAGTGAAIGSTTNVRVTASDGQSSTSADFTITISEGPGATITGTAIGETINGTFRAEAINAIDGDDIINGSAGADAIDGGLGIDIVSYATSAAGVTISLSGAAGTGGDANGDTLANVEDIVGSAFSDTLTGNGGANIIDAGFGDDTIWGGAGNDMLAGNAGADTLRGEDGDDNLLGGSGADILDGGTGTDYANYYYSSLRTGGDFVSSGVTADLGNASLNTGIAAGDSYISIENLYGTAFADTLRGDGGANLIHGDAGADSLWGRAGNDTLLGGDGNDSLVGEEGSDSVSGGAGDDWVYGGSGGDTLDGGTGIDWLSYRFTDGGAESLVGVNVDLATGAVSGGDAAGDIIVLGSYEGLEGSGGNDVLRGGAAGESFQGNGGADSIYGMGGNDSLYGWTGNDYLDGGDGNDGLYGGDGVDTLIGGAGADTIQGELGNDSIFGGLDADTIDGGDGDDTIYGEGGADIITGGIGNDTIHTLVVGEDTIDGGTGIDTASFAAAMAALTIDLANAAHKLTNIENVTSGSGNDALTGTAADNRLDGGAGNDLIDGGIGNDMLIGGVGDDSLIGGAGADNFSGGAGFDTVNYANAAAGANFNSTANIGGVTVASTQIATAETRTLNGVFVHLGTAGPSDGIRARNSDAAGDTFISPIDIERIKGSDYYDELHGSDGASVVIGGVALNPHLNPGTGDVIYGGDGNDTLYGDITDFSSTVGDDDIIYGQGGQDTIYGGGGNDRLFGEGDPDTLYGGAGNDILDAGDAGDMLYGDAGDDIMIGGLGDDQYWLTKTSGSDTIHNYSSTTTFDDVVQYSADITKAELWFTKVNGTKDLRVKVLGTSSQVIIKDWFVNTNATDFTNAGAQYVLRMFIAGQSTATTVDSLSQLLSIMKDIPEPPVSITSLTAQQQADINNAWVLNTPPSVVAVAGNPVTLNEDGLATLYFDVSDNNQTPLSAIDLLVAPTGAVVVENKVRHSSIAGRWEVTVRGAPNASGAGTLKVNASDSVHNSADLFVPLTVAAVADGVTINPIAGVGGNPGTPINLPAVVVNLTDSDGSEVRDYVMIEAIPVGAILSDGTNSFTASAGSTAVDVKNWALGSLRITPPAGSSTDFTLTVRSRSRETSNNAVSADATRTFAVDVNSAPTAIGFSPVGFNENTVGLASGGIPVGTLSATDSEGGAFSYAIVGGAQAAKFRIEGSSIYLATGQSLDFEAGDALVDIRVSDNGGLSFTRTGIAIRPANVNEAPTAPTTSNGNVTVNENGGVQDTGVRYSAIDPDGNALTYQFGDSGTAVSLNGLFEIRNGNQLWAVNSLNYEFQTTYTYNIYAHDGTQNSTAPVFQTITVGNVNEAPLAPMTSNSNVNFAENATGDTGVRFSSSDPDGDPISYFFGATSSTTYGPYQIVNGNQLWITAPMDFENPPPASFSVYALANGQVSSSYAWQTVTVTNVNEAPVVTTVASVSLAENSVAGTVIANLTATDPEGATPSWSLIGAPGFVSIIGNQLQLAAASLNYEAATSYTFTIRATDGGGLPGDKTFTLNVTNVNEVPYNIRDVDGALGGAVTEGVGGYTGIQIQADDPEGAATLIYSITGGNASAWFSINATTGQIYASSAIDRENTTYVTSGQITLSVTATDNGSPALPASRSDVVVTIANVNEAPSGLSSTNSNYSIAENITGNTGVTFSAADPDGDAISYIFQATGTTANGKYSILNGNQLWITSPLNYEADPHGSFAIVAVANGQQSAPITQNVTIINANEAPSTPGSNAPVVGFNENQTGDTGVRLSSSDPENDGITYYFSANGLQSYGNFQIVGNQLHVSGLLNFESQSSHSLGIYALANGQTSGIFNQVVNVGNLNDNAPNAPGIAAWGTTTFNEAVSVGSTVVAYLTAPTDPDGALNALSHLLTYDPTNKFEIVGNEVRVKVGVVFDVDPATGGAAGPYWLEFKSSDGVNQSAANGFYVTVNSADDNLPIAGGITNQGAIIAENAYTPGLGTVVATASASEADGDGITWSIVGGNATGALGVNASGQLFIANGFNYEALGGAANLGVDPNIGFSVTVRAAQSNNSGRYIDQTLNIQIADIAEVEPIWTYVEQMFGVTTDIGNGFFFEKERTGGGGGPGGQGPGPDMYWRIVRYPAGVRTIVAEQYSHINLGLQYDNISPGFQWNGPSWAVGSVFMRSLPPIVLDLNNDGEITSNLAAAFDIDGDGRQDKTGWISGGDAFLALDRDGNGMIDHGAEISFINDKPGAKTDLEGLSAYDSNSDGVFDAKDARFGEFLVWQDKDEDGVSDAGELKSLTEAGIASINLISTPVIPSDEGGVAVFGTSTFTRTDGTAGAVGDVALRWEDIAQASAATAASAEKVAHAVAESDVALATPLAFDVDGNGVIDPATEVARTVAAASAFDSNTDSMIDARDARYFDLRIWDDANKNGRAEPQELVGLSQSATPTLDLNALAAVVDAPGPVDGDTASPAVEPPPALEFQSVDFNRKSGKYLLEVRGSELFVTLRKANGVIDQRAGGIGGATIIEFKNKSYGLLSPIILDLDGDGIDMVSMKKSKAQFDMDGDGTLDRTGWVGKGDGMLVIDRNNDGLITGASELSFLTEDPTAKSDLAALAKLDANRDGKIDASDARFGELKVWVDANRNGVTDSGELKTLADVGINEISVAGRTTEQKVKLGKNIVLATATFTRSNGTTGTLGDVAFAFAPSSTKAAAALPAAANDQQQGILKRDPADNLAERVNDLGDLRLAALRSAVTHGFQRTQDLPLTLEAYASDTSSNDVRIAAMVQAMASFGGSVGEGGLQNKNQSEQNGLDWLTVSNA